MDEVSQDTHGMLYWVYFIRLTTNSISLTSHSQLMNENTDIGRVGHVLRSSTDTPITDEPVKVTTLRVKEGSDDKTTTC